MSIKANLQAIIQINEINSGSDFQDMVLDAEKLRKNAPQGKLSFGQSSPNVFAKVDNIIRQFENEFTGTNSIKEKEVIDLTNSSGSNSIPEEENLFEDVDTGSEFSLDDSYESAEELIEEQLYFLSTMQTPEGENTEFDDLVKGIEYRELAKEIGLEEISDEESFELDDLETNSSNLSKTANKIKNQFTSLFTKK